MEHETLIAVAVMCEYFAVACDDYERNEGRWLRIPLLRTLAEAHKANGGLVADLAFEDHGVWLLTFGISHPDRVLVTGSLDEALEAAAEVLPVGCFTEPDYEGARQTLIAATGKEPSEEEVHEYATVDMTYTERGYIGSDEWQVLEIMELDELAAVVVAS